jgi:hypothetical protein
VQSPELKPHSHKKETVIRIKRKPIECDIHGTLKAPWSSWKVTENGASKRTTTLWISASQVVRIMAMSHWCLATQSFLNWL